MSDPEVVSIEGPVEMFEGGLALIIPVRIPSGLAETLKISDGSVVSVTNTGGKFNIFPRSKPTSQ